MDEDTHILEAGGIDIHGGDVASIAETLQNDLPVDIEFDFSVNLNPLGPPLTIDRQLASCVATDSLEHYPQPHPTEAEEHLAKTHNVDSRQLIVGNGATELLDIILSALKPSSVLCCGPSYSGYEEICNKNGINIDHLPALSDGYLFEPDFQKTSESDAEVIIICTPNNPTGQLAGRDKIVAFAKANPAKYIIVDESFMDFTEGAKIESLIDSTLLQNIIVVKSLTKFFAIAGIRLGFAYASARIINRAREFQLPWSVNGVAQKLSKLLYKDTLYLQKTPQEVSRLRNIMIENLNKVDCLTPCPSSTNFILCRCNNGTTADDLQQRLITRGILIRSCSRMKGFGSTAKPTEYVRLAVRPERELQYLFSALNALEIPDQCPPLPTVKQLPRGIDNSIMFVGTASNSGKSLMVTAFCRLFAKQGIKTAPFKAQNMALNSFVTECGGEMGRAQVVQAEAAGIKPHTDMNPVLLKPQGNRSSQVIVDGKPIGTKSVKEYYSLKNEISQKAFEAYDRLKKRYKLIVIEGAGSPAEINLMAEDFVNMRMAEYASAPTILIADIDRGGVFASIFGTIRLLPKQWRSLIKAVIINKFRGDKSLLDQGIKEIEELTGVPVLGVVPYINDVRIEEEDSLGLEKRKHYHSDKNFNGLDIALIRLPMISNYTDFMPLENAINTQVRYIDKPCDLSKTDLIIIPGTKTTINDTIFLHKSGLAKSIQQAASAGVPIIGICGGYQILGNKIYDPEKLEGTIDEVNGLGLLPVTTILSKEKKLAQVAGVTEKSYPFASKSVSFEGYEIHSGTTTSNGADSDKQPPIPLRLNGEVNKATSTLSTVSGQLIFGCYIHGFFDSHDLRQELLQYLCTRKGIACNTQLNTTNSLDKEIEFDRITNIIKENIDLKKLFDIIQKT